MADVLQGVLHGIHRFAGFLCDLTDAPSAKLVHAVADDPIFQRICALCPFKLQHQAFAQVTSGNSRRMKRLHNIQHSLYLATRVATGKH